MDHRTPITERPGIGPIPFFAVPNVFHGASAEPWDLKGSGVAEDDWAFVAMIDRAAVCLLLALFIETGKTRRCSRD